MGTCKSTCKSTLHVPPGIALGTLGTPRVLRVRYRHSILLRGYSTGTLGAPRTEWCCTGTLETATVLRGLTLFTDQLRHRRASAPICRRYDMGARDGRRAVGCPRRAHHRDRRRRHDVLDGRRRGDEVQRCLAEHRRGCKCDLVST
jgi:hypothetical protein